METRARRRTSSLPRMTRRKLFSSSAARRAVATRVWGAIIADSTMGVALLAVTDVTANRSQVPVLGGVSVFLRDYCPNSAGLPVNRSIRFAVGGWVENKLPKVIPPRNGAMMKRCAVDGLAIRGR